MTKSWKICMSVTVNAQACLCTCAWYFVHVDFSVYHLCPVSVTLCSLYMCYSVSCVCVHLQCVFYMCLCVFDDVCMFVCVICVFSVCVCVCVCVCYILFSVSFSDSLCMSVKNKWFCFVLFCVSRGSLDLYELFFQLSFCLSFCDCRCVLA